MGRIPQSGVSALHFSPKGSLLLTWHRKKAEEPNLLVWSIKDMLNNNSTIVPLIGFHLKIMLQKCGHR